MDFPDGNKTIPFTNNGRLRASTASPSHGAVRSVYALNLNNHVLSIGGEKTRYAWSYVYIGRYWYQFNNPVEQLMQSVCIDSNSRNCTKCISPDRKGRVEFITK